MAQNRSFEKPAVETVRMSQQELAFILAEIDRKARAGVGRELRTEDRHGCDQTSPTLVRVDHPGGTAVDLIVRPRNISRHGIGFLNGSFIHAGTRLSFHLTSLDNEKHIITGKVVRCTHIRGLVHDVGVRLDAPLEVHKFIPGVEPDVSAQSAAAREAARGQYRGAALCVDDSLDDRELCKFLLERLGLSVQAVSSGDQAMQLVGKEFFDIVLVDLWLREIDGMRFAFSLRSHGHKGPVVAMAVDPGVEIETRAIQHGFDHVIAKPLSEGTTQDLAQRFLRKRAVPKQCNASQEKPLLSSSWSDLDMRPLIVGFVSRIDRHLNSITQHVRDTNFDALQQACMDLKGSAGGYGYPRIAEACEHLQMLATIHAHQDQVRAQLEELTELCTSARRVLNSDDDSAGKGGASR